MIGFSDFCTWRRNTSDTRPTIIECEDYEVGVSSGCFKDRPSNNEWDDVVFRNRPLNTDLDYHYQGWQYGKEEHSSVTDYVLCCDDPTAYDTSGGR